MTDEPKVHAATMAELGVLTASLLHELRQPLFTIKALAQMVQVKGRDADRLSQLLSQVGHMEQLIGYYGEFSRKNDPVVPFDLNEPTREALAMLAHRGRSLGVVVDEQLLEGGVLVKGHRGAALQVAVNLLQNAYDALEEVQGRRLVVRTKKVDGMARLEVEDSGPGIAEELVATIFEPFVTTTGPERGTGLGMYISRQLVERTHGELRLFSKLGKGTRVEVDLPFSQP